MVKKATILTGLLFILMGITYGQTSGWVEDFNNGDISRFQVDLAHQATFQLSSESGSLKINYTRQGGGHEWDNMHYTPSSLIDMSAQPLISLKIKSTITTTLSVKPVFDNGTDNFLTAKITGDQAWHVINIKLTSTGVLKMKQMYMYINGGSSAVESGQVWIDEFRFGDSASALIDWTALDRAITSTQALLLNSVEGTQEGQFPAGSKALLESALTKAQTVRNGSTKDVKVINQAVWDLYDACATFEKSAFTPKLSIVDSLATKETKHLYLNLLNLNKRALLFGMQDVTGYGVGWTDDDDRSDVKSVCGDYPALYSEDINNVERNGDLERQRYRITSAYNRGGVTTFVWHQNDPDGRGFYSTDVNNERIVSTIIPGGSRHNEYKTKLRNIAAFVKSLKGANGESIPVIFRPYHEHVGNWFWWGPAYASTQEFSTLWQFTVKYLRDSCNVHNMLWAMSPSLDMISSGDQYFQVYPGDHYVDFFGADFYFGDTVTDTDKSKFLGGLQTLVRKAASRNKIAALTEVGQEGLKTSDWFTNVLLPPLKTDSVAGNVIYAAVWRNANTTHHYAPYPGHPSVPDFLKFFNDPYTYFEKDLPKMYAYPEADKTAPKFVNLSDAVILSTKVPVSIKLETDERAFLRYSFIDEPYSTMPYKFDTGEGAYLHTAAVDAKQGDNKTIYVRAADIFGNFSYSSAVVKFTVDTLQALVAWTDPLYSLKGWSSGLAPIGTGSTSVTKAAAVRTIYFRNNFELNQLPKGLGILVRINGGAAVTLNGYEIGRINLPLSTDLKFDTDPTASASISKIFTLDSIALKHLVVGKNTITVEAHAPASSSIDAFDSKVFDEKFNYFVQLGSNWNYFDKGYRPLDVKLGDISPVSMDKNMLPEEYRLYGNYPNPFNPSTVIRYDIPKNSNVTINVFDILGRKVATLMDQYQSAGRYELQFDGARLSSGIYILQMKADQFYKVHKMMLLK